MPVIRVLLYVYRTACLFRHGAGHRSLRYFWGVEVTFRSDLLGVYGLTGEESGEKEGDSGQEEVFQLKHKHLHQVTVQLTAVYTWSPSASPGDGIHGHLCVNHLLTSDGLTAPFSGQIPAGWQVVRLRIARHYTLAHFILSPNSCKHDPAASCFGGLLRKVWTQRVLPRHILSLTAGLRRPTCWLFLQNYRDQSGGRCG